jgi:hypothetical protein
VAHVKPEARSLHKAGAKATPTFCTSPSHARDGLFVFSAFLPGHWEGESCFPRHPFKSLATVVRLKSGRIKSGDIRDLRGTLEREEAEIAVFHPEDPRKEMLFKATSAGFYYSPGWDKDYLSSTRFATLSRCRLYLPE